MTTSLQKVMALLAASDLDASDIAEALQQARTISRASLGLIIRKLRLKLRSDPGLWSELGVDAPTVRATADVRQEAAASAARVLSLFQQEGDADSVVRALVHAAGIVGIPRYEIPPFRAKDGLLRWLKRVEATIGPSRLMQIAVIAVSHRDTTDWPLKDES